MPELMSAYAKKKQTRGCCWSWLWTKTTLGSVNQRPNGEVGPILHSEFSKYLEQVLLNRSFRQVQLVCNFLV